MKCCFMLFSEGLRSWSNVLFGGKIKVESVFFSDMSHMAVGQNLLGTFWEDYHLLKGFFRVMGGTGFDSLPYVDMS